MGHGFVEVTVTAGEVKAQTDFSDTLSDSFRIVTPEASQAEGNVIFVLLFLVPNYGWSHRVFHQTAEKLATIYLRLENHCVMAR